MPSFRIRNEGGAHSDTFDFDDLAEAVVVSTTVDSFELLGAGGAAARFTGQFVYGDGPDTLPTDGTLTGLVLIEDGEVELSLTGLSLSVAELFEGLRERRSDDVDDAVLDLFDVDAFSEGAIVRSDPDTFSVAWGAEVATFTGSFTYSDGALPVSGTITGFQFAEDGEVERSLTGLSVAFEDLLSAMARDEGEDDADESEDEDDESEDEDDESEDEDDEDEAGGDDAFEDDAGAGEEGEGEESEDEEADEAAQREAEALLDAFDIDPFDDGVFVSGDAAGFSVAYGDEIAAFTGDFVYGDGPDAVPTSGTITGFTLTEDGEVERDIDSISVALEDLLSAMAIDAEPEDAPEPTSLFAALMGGNDRVQGSAASDAVAGFAGRDRLVGRGGDDELDGGDDRDVLRGGPGNDTLHGGEGGDVLVGGAGADVFDFDDVADSPSVRLRDVIRDFRAGDLIDLADIDADAFTAGDQAFTLITGRFTGEAGELMVRGNSLKGDVDGDGDADLFIKVKGAQSFDVDDFLL